MPTKAKEESKGPSADVLRLPMKWGPMEGQIPLANAFYFVYEKEQAVLFVGYVEPLITVMPKDSMPKELPVNLLARYLLPPKAFLRLKDQVDEVYEGMKAKGVFNE